MMATTSGEDGPAAEDPIVGTEIGGRYVVRRLVARGGMGSVYQGLHLELGRPVAIKVLSRTYARDEEAVKRFQREARTAGRIDHPNIVAILDLGRLDTGEPYLVMELLEGEDLADLIAREGPMRPARVVELLSPIASALDAVHREGLLHRDIKPANIFLAKKPDGTIVPKLLDFGLAALRDGPDADRLTREGIVVGTPHYVSPEAAEGAEVDQRSDVYSLGLVAFEMLAGVLPIDGERPMSLMYAKVRRPAPTLSQRTGKPFPPALEQLIARTLSRTPDKRPRTAGELMSEMAALLPTLPSDATDVDLPRVAPDGGGPPEHERPMVPSEQQQQLPTDRRTRWIVAALAAASLLAMASGAWVAITEEQPALRARELPRPEPPPVEARREEQPAPAPPREEPAPEPSAVAVPEPASEPPAAPARAPRPLARANGAPAPLSQAASVAAPAPPEAPPLESDPVRAAALTREAGAALLRGELPRARQLYRQATYTDSSHAPAWRGLGLASERMGMTPEAAAAYRRYLELAPSAPDAQRVRARLAQLGGAEGR